MSVSKFGWLLLFGGVLAGLLTLSTISSSYASGTSPCLSTNPTLEKVKDLAPGELPPFSINGNRDCQIRNVITRPSRLLPTPQAEQSHQSCVVDTGFGAYSQSG